MAVTRFGEAGYGVRRAPASAFSGKTQSDEPAVTAERHPFVYRKFRRLRARKRLINV